MLPNYDWHDPDVGAEFKMRLRALERLRMAPEELPAIRGYYKTHIPQFISDWGCTFDPRNPERDLPSTMPFVLYPKQAEWVDWVIDSWKRQKSGVTPKSRETGASWLSVATAVSLCLFNEGLAIGFGSRKAEMVDSPTPKSLFWKARRFISLLPPEFRMGVNLDIDAPNMRINFHQTDSVIAGEGGDNIGRGDRASIYFVDEAAFLEHPEIADAALSQTTNCRIEVSTPNGLGGPFHRKVTDWPKDQVFPLHWRDDPRKDQAWYDKQVANYSSLIVAQEINIDFAASVGGVVIPSTWVQSAIDAHVKLGIHPTGARRASLDVADEGTDKCAVIGGYGFLIDALDEWSGKGDDIFGTTVRAFDFCDANSCEELRFDSDGLGAGVRGDARVVNENRAKAGKTQLRVLPYRGSSSVVDPTKEDVKGRKNEDYFANCKAQMWWNLRTLFENTHEAVTKGVKFDADKIISISSHVPMLAKLTQELSQATFSMTTTGKIIIDKMPDGARSPNLADGVVIQRARIKVPLAISDAAMAAAGRR